MTSKPIALKVLLRQRHLQGHRAFCKEYDKVAKRIDPELVGGWPSKAQFYRWLSGELVGLPYADHCRVLEAMFPDWKAAHLFRPHNGGIESASEPTARRASTKGATSVSSVTVPNGHDVADIVAVFPTRSEFAHAVPPHRLFDGARKIRMVGLSLNFLCQHYPDKALREQLETGTIVECLFLDPDGTYIRLREQEESHAPDVLTTLTRLNIQTLQRVRAKLSPETRNNLKIRTYDEVLRYNITLVDDVTCVLQPYLPDVRGVESPTIVMDKRSDVDGLFDIFANVFVAMWNRAKEVAA